MRSALRGVQAIVAGSQAVVASHRAFGLVSEDAPVHVVPYGVAQVPHEPRRPAALPLRVGFVGTLMPHKGAHVALQAFAGLSAEDATLDVWGHDSAAPEYARALRAGAPKSVRFHGSFDEADKGRVLAAMDLLVVPSIGLESFALIANEAAAAGVPVLASRLGALEERIASGSAEGFAPGDADGLRARIAELVAHPEQLARWRARLPRVETVAEHALAIEAIYAQVLGRP
jgi:glycosyltransferase involved in cell wall biosynthesis